jgi:hypothetical protein
VSTATREVSWTHALGLVGSRVILRFLAAGREPVSAVGSPTGTAELRTTVKTRRFAPDHGGERVDAIAGSEYLDDRIRLCE